MNKRIWFSTTSEHREIEKLERNQHKDILIHLDGGEIWQFTPHQKGIKNPPVSRIKQIGNGVETKTGKPSSLAWIILENPKENIEGNLRKLNIEPRKKAGRKPIDEKEGNRLLKHWESERVINGRLKRKQFWEENYFKIKTLDNMNNAINAAQKRRNRKL